MNVFSHLFCLVWFSESGSEHSQPPPMAIMARRRGSLANRSPRKPEPEAEDLEKQDSQSTCNDESPKVKNDSPLTPKKRTGGWPKGVKRGPRRGPGRPPKVCVFLHLMTYYNACCKYVSYTNYSSMYFLESLAIYQEE